MHARSLFRAASALAPVAKLKVAAAFPKRLKPKPSQKSDDHAFQTGWRPGRSQRSGNSRSTKEEEDLAFPRGSQAVAISKGRRHQRSEGGGSPGLPKGAGGATFLGGESPIIPKKAEDQAFTKV